MEQHPKERILLTQPTTGPVSDTGLQYANACHNKWGIDSVTKSGSPLAARGHRIHRNHDSAACLCYIFTFTPNIESCILMEAPAQALA
jgi:hypothetical protein